MSDNEIVKFIEAYIKANKKYSYKKQYNLNLLDEMDADENAHTRILLKLLSFKHCGTKPFLLEFIKAINTLLPDNVDPIPETDYEIEKQFHNMDGFIYNKQNGYCIIIESKVKEAPDRDKQIERYIKYAHKFGFIKNKIYFVYLTSDGNKQPLPISFTDEAKKILEYENEEKPGRFIQMNNRDHILPFLNNVLEMASFSKENILKTAVVQYINHLEGRFGLRKSEEEYKNAMMEELSAKLAEIIPNWESLTEQDKLKSISDMQNKMSNMMEQLKEQECPNTREFTAKRIAKYFKDKKYLICNNVSVESWKNGYLGAKFVLKVLGEEYLMQPSIGFWEYNNHNNVRIPFCKYGEKEILNSDIIAILEENGFKRNVNLYEKYITPIDLDKAIECIESLIADLEKLNQSAQKS